jgi:hypothetical protein
MQDQKFRLFECLAGMRPKRAGRGRRICHQRTMRQFCVKEANFSTNGCRPDEFRDAILPLYDLRNELAKSQK